MTKDNNSYDNLSKKIDKFVEEIDRQIEEVVKKVDEKIEHIGGEPRKKSRKHWDNSFWGIVLIVVGLLWLGNNLHWFRIHLPVWPLVLIVFGLYLLLEHRRRS